MPAHILTSSARCSLGTSQATSNMFSQQRVTQKRAVLQTRAAYTPNWDQSSPSNTPLHGVLHSSKLPSSLADRIDIYDARDAIEACSGLWGEEKETCYAIFGVAPEADEWYDVVFKLETALDMDTFPEEDASHHGTERC